MIGDGTDLAAIREAIARVAPEFRAATIAPLGEGMERRAYRVGGDHAFLVPKFPDVAARLEVEARLLPALAPRLTLPIPGFDYVGRRDGGGLAFAGYRLVEGEPLWPETLAGLGPAEAARVAREFAGFLAELAAFPVAEALALGVPMTDFRARAERALGRARAEIAPHVGAEARAYVERLFAGYLDDARNFAYEPSLLHADLSPEHILLAPSGGLAGVIDFGDAQVGDPDYDLLYVAADIGNAFLNAVLSHLPPRDRHRLSAKHAFFDACSIIDDALMGLDRRHEPTWRESLARLEAEARGDAP